MDDDCNSLVYGALTNRSAGELASFKESRFDRVVRGEDLLTLLLGVADGEIQEGVDGVRGIDLDVDDENHEDEHNKDDYGVNVTGQEGSLESTGGCVENHTPD